MARNSVEMPPKDGDPLWQQDFPINRGEELDNSRRQFLKFLALTSAAFFTGTLGMMVRALVEQQQTETLQPMKIASVADVPEGSFYSFHYPDASTAGILIHLPGGEFVAYEQACTHLLCPVIYQNGQKRIYCPCHEGEFDPATGRNISGPPPRPLNKIYVEVRGTDVYAVGRS